MLGAAEYESEGSVTTNIGKSESERWDLISFLSHTRCKVTPRHNSFKQLKL